MKGLFIAFTPALLVLLFAAYYRLSSERQKQGRSFLFSQALYFLLGVLISSFTVFVCTHVFLWYNSYHPHIFNSFFIFLFSFLLMILSLWVSSFFGVFRCKPLSLEDSTSAVSTHEAFAVGMMVACAAGLWVLDSDIIPPMLPSSFFIYLLHLFLFMLGVATPLFLIYLAPITLVPAFFSETLRLRYIKEFLGFLLTAAVLLHIEGLSDFLSSGSFARILIAFFPIHMGLWVYGRWGQNDGEKTPLFIHIVIKTLFAAGLLVLLWASEIISI